MASPLLRSLFVALALGGSLTALRPERLAAQGAAQGAEELAAPQYAAPRAAPLAEPAPPDRWLGPDKPLHAFAGWWVAAAAYGAAAAADRDPADRRLAAATASLAAGVAKEALDAAVQGEPFSWRDLTAGALGLMALLAFTVAAES